MHYFNCLDTYPVLAVFEHSRSVFFPYFTFFLNFFKSFFSHGYVKFRHVSLLFLSVTPAFSNVHADPYDIRTLPAHLEQKLGSIQTEYQKVQSEKQFSYLWDETYKGRPNNLCLRFFGKGNVHSKEEVESQEELLFPSEERLIKFISVFTSNNFLNMLFGNNFVDWFVARGAEDLAIVEWNKEPSNDLRKHLFSLHIWFKCFKYSRSSRNR